MSRHSNVPTASADQAYAEAMRQLTMAYPADMDALTLYAEALMDLRPWNYWTRDGQPYAETTHVIDVLTRVLDKNPNHPGALHLWIHLWESTDTPERAEAEADRLLPLMPGAGHIVHMPAHIYQRVGRHADVIASNLQAAKADEDYIAQCRAQGVYPLAYYPHNLHFIWMGATASGQKTLALDSARRLANAVPTVLLAAGRADEAETVLWDDLKRNPGHVWTLSLLSQALKAQQKMEDAEAIGVRLRATRSVAPRVQ